MAAKKLKIWYDREADYLEVLFDQREGFFRETTNDQVMEKVDSEGNIFGFSVLRASALTKTPLASSPAMRIRYDEKIDALSVRMDDSKIVDSDEVKPGIVLDFNAKKQIVGIEVLDFKRRLRKGDLTQLKVLVA